MSGFCITHGQYLYATVCPQCVPPLPEPPPQESTRVLSKYLEAKSYRPDPFIERNSELLLMSAAAILAILLLGIKFTFQFIVPAVQAYFASLR